MSEIKTALISVSDKNGIVEFAKNLSELGIKVISTGGTAKLLQERGVNVTEISEHTKSPEMLDGRVKTLHPKIHGGILAVRDNDEHIAQMEKFGIDGIDLVVVNLYPFEKTIQKDNVPLSEVIENIDIGGPSMIRSAAKNYRFVTVVVNPEDYNNIISELKSKKCCLTEEFRFKLAVEAFKRTFNYDQTIANYLGNLKSTAGSDESLSSDGGDFPGTLSIELKKKQNLRYGENPHQSATFYIENDVNEPCVANAEILHGKELSFNNIIDLNAAWEIVTEFSEPSAIVIKHTNPCGAGYADKLSDAFVNAYSGDPVSAFGCILGLNRCVDVETAKKITEPGHFVEAIIAPDYDVEAIEILTTLRKWGKNLRLLKTGTVKSSSKTSKSLDMKKVGGGLLVQERDLTVYDKETVKYITNKTPSQDEMKDLEFAFTICKHVKSNSIVLAKNGMVTGVGAGQMSRVDSAEIAVKKAGDKAKGSVLASDAFFPFRDTIDIVAKAGIISIIQPGGSNRDDEVIAAANEHNISMVLTGTRHFKH